MAVYTQLSQDDAKFICQSYGLSEPHRLAAIAHGMENSNYFLDCRDGSSWVITLFEEINAQHVGFFCKLLQQLPSSKIPVAAPINTLQQQAFISLYNKPVIVCPKVSGEHVETPNTNQCQAISEALAAFHNFTQTSTASFTGVRPIEWLTELVEISLSLLSPQDQHCVEITLQQFQQAKHLPGLKKGLCHCDLFRDNSLFLNNKLTAVLDFYSASEHFYLFDLAVLINDWAHCHGLNPEKQQVIITAYQSIRPLSAQEQQQLPLFLQVAAMRFWLSRLLEKQKTARAAGSIKPYQPYRKLFFDLSSSAA